MGYRSPPTRLMAAMIALLAPASALAQGALAQGALQRPADVPADRLCPATARDVADGVLFPSDAALAATAETVERSLDTLRARGDASSADPATLALPMASRDAPSALALAGYCAAAGEMMRLSAGGSQRQAQSYLLAAYRFADGGPLASRAAYRLALVGVSEPGADGTRGASSGRRRGSGEAAIPLDERAAMSADSACGELTAGGVNALTSREVSLVALACAADQSLRAGDRPLAALANLKLSRLEGAFADLPGEDREAFRSYARERAQRAIAIALTLDPEQGRVELLGRLAQAAVDYGDTGGSEVGAALAALRAQDDAHSASILASLQARLALARGDGGAARAHAQAAILAESRRPVPARLPLHYLLLAQTDPEARAAHVHAAYVALDNLRPLLPRLDPLTEESSFALYMREVFVAAAEVQLASADGPDQDVRIRRAQEIVEAYRQAELQSAFGSECLPPRTGARMDALRPGETILYPLLLPDRVELLVVSRGEGAGAAPRYRRLPPNRDVTRADVARLVEQVSLPLSYGEGEWRTAARALYDILIAPVADRLGPDSLLAIVPDGALRALPFAALVAPDGRFLVQQTRLSLIPALAFAQPAGEQERAPLTIVAASLQREMNLPVGSFAALEGTAAEARIAVGHARSGQLVLDFTRADLIDALDRRVDVLHLATHAAFNGRSDRAFIVANGEVIRLSELRDIIGRTRLRGDAIDLIVLSACETAVGDDEASMGLAGAAVQAGARSVIGSLWQVDDAGTAGLMREFYGRYSQGRSRSHALREAQLALIDGGGANASPSIWAAFSLLGAWR